ncbi:hypothetical protein IMZ48_00160 [Candidatus Bathyarchaeota archaeon]|nr:hypothetical protein [Candidatus Bathyarchaeota archaeon]
MRRLKEEQARLDAEAKARFEEEERILAEELKQKEEARAIKKQKEKEKIEQLKKEGKFMTKAQREEKARNEMKLQQMVAAGIKVGPTDEAEGQEKKNKKKEISKKRGARKNEVCILRQLVLRPFATA